MKMMFGRLVGRSAAEAAAKSDPRAAGQRGETDQPAETQATKS
jgi:hypothetical protein